MIYKIFLILKSLFYFFIKQIENFLNSINISLKFNYPELIINKKNYPSISDEDLNIIENINYISNYLDSKIEDNNIENNNNLFPRTNIKII
tara:strand:- start:840 stop:1112 length:273 start_codon:yes stop_codon:yes gene_type:complete